MSETSYEQNLRLREEEAKRKPVLAPKAERVPDGVTSLEQQAVINKVPE